MKQVNILSNYSINLLLFRIKNIYSIRKDTSKSKSISISYFLGKEKIKVNPSSFRDFHFELREWSSIIGDIEIVTEGINSIQKRKWNS